MSIAITTASRGVSPLRPVLTGAASYRLDEMSVGDELHPVIQSGRVAVVTGAASSIGRAAAEELARCVQRCFIGLSDRRDW